MKAATNNLSKTLIVISLFIASSTLAIAQTAISNLDTSGARASAGGAVPRVVKYAGSLAAGQDPAGSAVATTVSVTFALYAEEGATSPVWTEMQTVAVGADGKYTVLLGAMSKEGLSSELFQAGESRWLGIKSGEGLEQRVLLVSVPYAMKSEDAETLGGHKVTDFLLTPEAAAAAGVVQSDLTTRPRADAQVSTLITDNGVSVGINNTTPETGGVLDIAVNNTAQYVKFNSPNPYGLRLGSLSSGAQFLGMGVTKTGNDNKYIATSGNNSLVNHTVVEFNYNGQVRFLGAAHQADGTDLTNFLTPSLLLTSAGQFVVGTTSPETQSLMDIEFTTDKYIKFNGMRFGQLQSGTSFISEGVAKTGADNNYIANTGGSAIANHGVLEFDYTGRFGYRLAAHQADGTNLNNLLVTAFTVSGASDSSFGHMGIGATPSANQLEVGGATNIAGKVTDTGEQVNGNAVITGTLAVTGALTVASCTGCGGGGTITAGTTVTGGTSSSILNAVQTSNVTSNTSSTVINNAFATGLRGYSSSTASTFASGVLGAAVGPDAYGVFGMNVSSGPDSGGVNNNAIGVFGDSASNAVGVNGGTNGTGVWGQADEPSGDAIGVYGQSSSPNGTGVFGYSAYSSPSTATSDGVGVYGLTVTPGGIGVWGITQATASTASGGNPNVGVYGSVQPSSGTASFSVAGLFDTFTASDILIGRNVVGSSAAHVFRVDSTGKGYFDGGTVNSGADFAESVEVKEEKAQYGPGDVMVIDTTGTRRFELAAKPYSTLVAGIYATKPGVLATTHDISDPRIANAEIPMAIVGIVPCKVTNENGDIEVGDLLVTSSTPGRAMKGTDRSKMTGAVVGKALQAMHGKNGVIEVLVSLQ